MYKLICLMMVVASSLFAADDMYKHEKLETLLVQMINVERAKEGLEPLYIWPPLVQVARVHSRNMADGLIELGHDGFQDRFEEMQDYAYVSDFAENVAYSYNVKDHLKSAVRGWMHSPGHKKNILGDYRDTAIGIAFDAKGKFYVTQLFANHEE